MKRLIFVLLGVTTLLSMRFAAAASLGGLTANNLGADDALVSRCDNDGVTTTYNLGTNNTVASVTIGSIAGGCSGSQLSLTLSKNDGSSVGSGSQPVSGSSVTVPISSTPAVADVKALDVIIVGP